MKDIGEKKYVILLSIGIIFVIISPILLTRPSFNSIFNLTETGNIGSTIGGITAPFVGLIGAILVYRSFIVQIRANQEIRKENFLNIMNRYVSDLFKKQDEFLINSALSKFKVIEYLYEEKGKLEDNEFNSELSGVLNILNKFEQVLRRTVFTLDKLYSNRINLVERKFILLFDLKNQLDRYLPIGKVREIYGLSQELLKLDDLTEMNFDTFKLNEILNPLLHEYTKLYTKVDYECKYI